MLRFSVLSWSLFKVFWRDRGSVFFTFLMPVIITSIFGLLNFGGFGSVRVGAVDLAGNQSSAAVLGALGGIDALKLSVGEERPELEALRRGERDLVLVFPREFAPSPRAGAVILLYENSGHPQQVGVGRAVLTQAVDRLSFAVLGAEPIARFERREVAARNLGYIDFLLPGMIAFSVMQLGVFSVAFGIVNAKRTGWLRRLMATPLTPLTFLAGNTVVRLVNVVIQVLVLVGLGVGLLRYRLVGSFPEVVAVAVLGGALFLTFGFAVAGASQSEDQAAPLANLITLPQAFLSGVWFGRDTLPGWLRPIADYFPLSYLADALRDVSTQGAHLWEIGPQLAGLAVWSVVGFALAVRLFRFE